MAISDDGRYVAMSSGFGGSFPLKLYDLWSCIPNAENNAEVASGCKIKDVTEFMKEEIPGFVAPLYMEFSSDASELYLTASVNGGSGGDIYKQITLSLPGAETPRIKYMALGDSFVSGEGDTEGDEYYEYGTDGELHPDEKCHVSKRSYSYLIARHSNVGEGVFKNIACAGAVKEDVTNTFRKYLGHFKQYELVLSENRKPLKDEAVKKFILGRAAQIEFVEKYKPETVTIGLGGNDIGFKSKLISCITSHITNLFASCKPATTEGDARAKVGDEINKLYKQLKTMYIDIHNVSKGTKIYAVGYPNIMKTGTACDINVLLDDNEREYAIQVVKYLNDVIEKAAKDAGVGYLDIEDSLEGLELCSGAAASIGVNGLRAGNDVAFIIGNESFHPNQKGHNAIANYIQTNSPDFLNNKYCDTPQIFICPSGDDDPPPLPDYFNYTQASFVQTVYNHTLANIVQAPKKLFNAVVSFFKPGSSVRFEIHSEPVQLGEFTADDSGNVNAELMLPDTIEPGYHELHAIGISPSGEPIDQYKHILVIHSEEDVDGDGVLNEDDPCSFVEPSGVDQDKDGNDDACDPFIGEAPLPAAPTIEAAEFVNTTNQNEFEISGEGDPETELHLKVEDANPETEPVTAIIELQSSESEKSPYEQRLNLSLLSDGELTITAKLVNEAGESPLTSKTVVKDTALPTMNTEGDSANTKGWYKDSVRLLLSADDEGAGVQYFDYETSGAQTISQTRITRHEAAMIFDRQGTTTLSYKAVDKAGNVGAATTKVIRIDTSKPTVKLQKPDIPIITSLLGTSIRGMAHDSISGIQKTEVLFSDNKGKQFKVDAVCRSDCGSSSMKWEATPNKLAVGVYAISAVSVDKAGNRSEQSPPVRMTIVSITFLHWL